MTTGSGNNHNSKKKDRSKGMSQSTYGLFLKLATLSGVVSIFFISTVQKAANAATTSEANNENYNINNGRRLTEIVGDKVPKYMKPVLTDLEERTKLMEETPPEEVKYWFEYTGPLQKYYYRFSKSRGKADSFEGRDDSGVTSARFMDETMGNQEYKQFFTETEIPSGERSQHARFLENCLAMGKDDRPDTGKGTLWNQWYASNQQSPSLDRCRILFTLNTVGAGRGTTMLWETNPPPLALTTVPFDETSPDWISEQETAATHLARNLREIDAMCAMGQVAARLQLLVCEPIPAPWTEWMDSNLPHCGGKPKASTNTNKAGNPYNDGIKVDERPSPVQVVVVANPKTANTCHDPKSGFMEKRMQDLIIAPPLPQAKNKKDTDPTIKTTNPNLVSTEDHDLYVALKWSSLVTVRAVNAFLQASADLAAGASSPKKNRSLVSEKDKENGSTIYLSTHPGSPFLIPSFVRVSYVSEENSKVAKWRMHGDFFHPAAWEVCKDSFDTAWIPDSLAGSHASAVCYSDRKEAAAASRLLKEGEDCGQWWLYMTEEQMPTTPEVYANEVTAPLIQGGSNYFWMVTESQRESLVRQMVCQREHHGSDDMSRICGGTPQAVMPLGDLESFLINFTPNTALGKKHLQGRSPGYSSEKEREENREKVRERNQLKGQEDVEKALFDYTIYPAALLHKDATLKAVRARDDYLTKKKDSSAIGPQTVKSGYYDVTITKPRKPNLGWCQALARKGLCALYSDYFRTSSDRRCMEACGLSKDWQKIEH